MRLRRCVVAVSTLLMVGSGIVIGASQTSEASQSSNAAQGGIPKGPIVIGLPIALTGDINFYDSQVLLGAQTEAAQLNAHGGIDGHKVKLVTADTASSIPSGGPAAEQVISEGAEFILPTVDYNFGGVAAQLAQKHNLIAISAADDPRMGLSIGDDVFNFDTTGANAGSVLAQFATQHLKETKGFVVLDTTLAAMSANCSGFTAAFKKLGGTVVGSTSYDATAAAQTAAVSAVQAAAAKFDVIMLCGYPPSGASVLKGIRADGVDATVLTTDAFDGNFWESALPDTSGIYTASYGIPTNGQGQGAAAAAIEVARKSGRTVSVALGYLEAYSALEAIDEAVTATGSVSANKIRPYFDSFRNRPFAIGPTTWTATCHARVGNPMIVADFANGVEDYVTTLKPTEIAPGSCV